MEYLLTSIASFFNKSLTISTYTSYLLILPSLFELNVYPSESGISDSSGSSSLSNCSRFFFFIIIISFGEGTSPLDILILFCISLSYLSFSFSL